MVDGCRFVVRWSCGLLSTNDHRPIHIHLNQQGSVIGFFKLRLFLRSKSVIGE